MSQGLFLLLHFEELVCLVLKEDFVTRLGVLVVLVGHGGLRPVNGAE